MKKALVSLLLLASAVIGADRTLASLVGMEVEISASGNQGGTLAGFFSVSEPIVVVDITDFAFEASGDAPFPLAGISVDVHGPDGHLVTVHWGYEFVTQEIHKIVTDGRLAMSNLSWGSIPGSVVGLLERPDLSEGAFIFGSLVDLTPTSFDVGFAFEDTGSITWEIQTSHGRVPDTGSTALMLGAGLLGLAAIRRKSGRN